MDIGSRLKELRILKGLTQEELADRAELSKGFISQVERNLTSPSIATLMDILQCLGTSVSEFFSETAEDQVVFGQQDYFKKLDGELLNEIQWIIPNAQKNRMEPILLTLKAGGSTCPDNPHEGEEFGYVLSGAVRIVIGDRRQDPLSHQQSGSPPSVGQLAAQLLNFIRPPMRAAHRRI